LQCDKFAKEEIWQIEHLGNKIPVSGECFKAFNMEECTILRRALVCFQKEMEAQTDCREHVVIGEELDQYREARKKYNELGIGRMSNEEVRAYQRYAYSEQYMPKILKAKVHHVVAALKHFGLTYLWAPWHSDTLVSTGSAAFWEIGNADQDLTPTSPEDIKKIFRYLGEKTSFEKVRLKNYARVYDLWGRINKMSTKI